MSRRLSCPALARAAGYQFLPTKLMPGPRPRSSARRFFARLIARLIAGVLQGFAVFLFYSLRLVPERLALRVARPLGALLRSGMKPRILAHLRLALGPERATGATAREFWRAHVRHLGLCVLEPVYFYWMSDEELLGRVAVEGEEHLRAVLDKGRGAILFINHLGNPGAIVAGLGMRRTDVTIAGNRLVATIAGEEIVLSRFERVVQRMFRRGRVERALLGERLPQRLAATLASNGVFAMFIDFPVVQKHCRRVSFGEAMLTANLGPAILALRQRAEVLPVTCRRTGDNHHRLKIHPPLPAPSVAGLEEGAAQLIQQAVDTLLTELRAHPDQWWPWDWAPLSAK
jgi:lauroyl/myristoyl acyltransferase